ncbi:hypothetical protein PHJA_001754900 [Phtheirospermum japonicum]|uniref:Uncharacterized protein n=1 Tax=Phtheirospermum japonicum TaxID=374723 RepID=A0A830CGC7_9LAMI|nr:hypothetical protein PHJA_001754900 [Phtheirospermum japonicum]
MLGNRHCTRIDTIELKHHIEMKLGPQRSNKYFNLLNKYLSLRLSKSEFDKLCIGLLGRESISLHNRLIRSIVKNACVANAPPNKDAKAQSLLSPKVTNGYQTSLQLLRDVFPQSPRKGRTPILRDRKSKDRLSPLGPNGKGYIVSGEDTSLKVQEQQSATEILLSLGSRPPVEVTSEEGEEVEQIAISPGIHSRARSPLKAPFGVSFSSKEKRKAVDSGNTCYNESGLPDTSALMKRLEQKLAVEGLNISTCCVNIINNGLDAFLKRLIKPCLDLAGTRPLQKPYVSMMDFEVAMRSNPRILGENWPLVLEKVAFGASDDYLDG